MTCFFATSSEIKLTSNGIAPARTMFTLFWSLSTPSVPMAAAARSLA
eukprot:CAMPEP_0197670936 /NCGR_PEP_ID=MMETSP1338-20131121/75652_1 /TAXON_ID=43686 ORGANISM="Pelagodinium beii, Strain RCC1491" /NCGR_SAMPLE_ID=MMETSP1338 /ASSEMBLY_ACC=CAM_ASM_000754 /LENGTH=46 /DNA_ID= /DNA_START= /DNA_END= /DNA_ORIENTATION=